MNQPTPIRHGDWRMVNGELVDFSKQPTAPTESAAPSTPAKPSAAASSGRTRNRSKKR